MTARLSLPTTVVFGAGRRKHEVELSVTEADFRETCARLYVRADTFFEVLKGVRLDRAIKERQGRVAKLLLQVKALNEAGTQGTRALPVLFEKIDRLNDQIDALWVARYGETLYGEPLAPKLAAAEQQPSEPKEGR